MGRGAGRRALVGGSRGIRREGDGRVPEAE